jgi:hypothetical protein
VSRQFKVKVYEYQYLIFNSLFRKPAIDNVVQAFTSTLIFYKKAVARCHSELSKMRHCEGRAKAGALIGPEAISRSKVNRLLYSGRLLQVAFALSGPNLRNDDEALRRRVLLAVLKCQSRVT